MQSPNETNGTEKGLSPSSGDRPQPRVAIPLIPTAAVPLIRAALEEAGALRRRALVRDVVARHRRGGNVLGAQSPVAVVKKALQDMCASGEVETVGYGTWALAGQAADYRVSLTPRVAVPLIREALAGGRALQRKALAKEVAAIHAESGGTIGTQSPAMVIKKALRLLLSGNEVENVGFGTWALTGQSAGYSVPLTPNVAKPLIVAALADGQIRHRRELAREVSAEHKRAGGKIGLRSATEVVAQALSNMARDGTAEHVAKGLWRLAVVRTTQILPAPPAPAVEQTPPTGEVRTHAGDVFAAQAQPQIQSDPAGDGVASLTIEDEIGEGQEVVYIYFNSNDRRLAELEGRLVWECKIGMAKTGDAIGRILEQGIRTSMSRMPTVVTGLDFLYQAI